MCFFLITFYLRKARYMDHKDYFTIKNKKLSMRCTFANRKLSTVTAQDELMVKGYKYSFSRTIKI